VHVLDLSAPEGREPLDDFAAINHELSEADPELAAKTQIVVANKLDLPEARDRFEPTRRALAESGIDLLAISAATGDGVRALVGRIAEAVSRLRHTRDEESAARGSDV
jgi:GTP-binding protein